MSGLFGGGGGNAAGFGAKQGAGGFGAQGASKGGLFGGSKPGASGGLFGGGNKTFGAAPKAADAGQEQAKTTDATGGTKAGGLFGKTSAFGTPAKSGAFGGASQTGSLFGGTAKAPAFGGGGGGVFGSTGGTSPFGAKNVFGAPGQGAAGSGKTMPPPAILKYNDAGPDGKPDPPHQSRVSVIP